MGLKQPLLWLLLLLNLLIWLPFAMATFPTIGIGHDSQLFAPGLHALLREGSMPWDLITRFSESRVDIFSYPYFSVVYPFYWTLGLSETFSYNQHLMLDASAVVFHMVLGSLLFGLLLSKMGCRTSIAAFGGIAYAYSLHMKLWSSWIWAIGAYAWIPLCLLGVWEIIAQRRSLRGILYLGVGFGMIALATGVGLVYAVVLAGAFTLALWCKQGVTPRLALLDVRSILAGGMLGMAIGAAHLLPVLNRMGDYIRWYSGGALVGGFQPPYEGTLAPALSFVDLQQFIFPMALESGKNVGHLYLGAALLLLALLLILREGPWRRLAWVLGGVSLYFLLDAFGDATFVHRINYHLPLLGSIRYPLANVVIPVILLTLMACLSLEQHLQQSEARGKIGLWASCMYVAVIVSVMAAYLMSRELQGGVAGFSLTPVFWLPALVSVVALVLTFRNGDKRMLTVLPLAVVFSYLPQFSMLMHPKIPDSTELYNQCEDFTRLESALRSWSEKYPENSRLMVHVPREGFEGCLGNKKLSDTLLQSLAAMTGWNVLQLHLSPRPYKEFKLFSRYASEKALTSHAQLLKAGISHVLTLDTEAFLGEQTDIYHERGRVGSFVLYEVKGWRLGQEIAGCLTGDEKRLKIQTGEGRRALELSLAELGRDAPELFCDDLHRGISPVSGKINRHISNGGIFYVLETYRPVLFVTDRVLRDDWEVKVNGEKVKPVLVDQFRVAVTLGEGLQKVELKHRPQDFRRGLDISLVGILVALCLMFRERYAVVAARRQSNL